MVLIVYLAVVLLVCGAGLLAAWLRVRAARVREVVQMLAGIVGQNLPLVPALRAAAAQESRTLARIYREIAAGLLSGDDLHAALRTALPSCPGEVAGAVRAGEAGGTLPAVLRRLAADARREPRPGEALRPAVPYLLAMLLVLPVMVLFLASVVMPKYREIMWDFGLEMPPLSQRVLGLTDWPGSVWLLVVLAAPLAGLCIVQAALGRHFLPRSADRFQPLYAAWDVLVWHLPLARQVASQRALARQLPVLQVAVRAGQPLPEAARQAGHVAANLFARRRLRRWAELLAAGHDPVDAARRTGLPAPVRQVLAAAQRGADLGSGLQFAADYYRALGAHWEHVLTSAVAPLIVLVWGALAGALIVAVILPLVGILNAAIELVE